MDRTKLNVLDYEVAFEPRSFWIKQIHDRENGTYSEELNAIFSSSALQVVDKDSDNVVTGEFEQFNTRISRCNSKEIDKQLKLYIDDKNEDISEEDYNRYIEYKNAGHLKGFLTLSAGEDMYFNENKSGDAVLRLEEKLYDKLIAAIKENTLSNFDLRITFFNVYKNSRDELLLINRSNYADSFWGSAFGMIDSIKFITNKLELTVETKNEDDAEEETGYVFNDFEKNVMDLLIGQTKTLVGILVLSIILLLVVLFK